MTKDNTNKLIDGGPDADDPIGQLASRAREELRQQAPRDGVARLEQHRQTQVRRRAATAAGVAALLVVVGLAVRVNRNGDDRISPATTTPATTTPSALDNFIITDTGASAAAAADPPVDAARDATIAAAAIIKPATLGPDWVSTIPLSSNAVPPESDADIAGMPRCEALRAAGKGMSPTGGTASPLVAFASGSLGNAIQRTFVFPTVEAASRQMDLIADRRWMACLAAIWDTNIPKLTPDVKRSTTIPANLSPPTPRGDRLITTSFMSLFEQASAGTRRFNMVSFVQVGRVIVNVIANPTMSDNTDPRNLIDKSLIAAVEAARSALTAP
jgi:hypothetical protein